MDFGEDCVPKNICLLANDNDNVDKHEIIDVIKFSNLENLPNEVHYDVLLYLLTVLISTFHSLPFDKHSDILMAFCVQGKSFN